MDGYSEATYVYDHVNTMSVFEVREDAQHACSARSITKNVDRLSKPFINPAYSGHFNFSLGRFLLDAGYDTYFTNAIIFNWEEPYQAFLAWKAGYTLYAPN